MCVEIHTSVEDKGGMFFQELRRKVYTTPKSYLDLIGVYLKMLEDKRKTVGLRYSILTKGLTKLKETEKIVEDLQVTLTDLQPKLKVKQKETAELLEKVAKDQAAADKVRTVVERETKIVEKQAQETGLVQKDAQADLDRALPALKAANTALKTLNKGDITEVKNMPKPPEGVVSVLEAVLILLKKKKYRLRGRSSETAKAHRG
eukprot:TRINITY_DN438_c0_g2_i1.p1 TRINITY_DN438_c0_g2~~TRINITY_DN438_c0_g2_i1.p1  ORF type:complete len:204 (-),score=53.44 TRINITY_DN438_c0_g2_i1:2-613(-)